MKKNELIKKLEELENRKFYHEMKDRWSREDFDYAYNLEREIREVKKELENI